MRCSLLFGPPAGAADVPGVGRENLEIADPLKPHLEHVEVVVVVFDVEHFGHDADPIPRSPSSPQFAVPPDLIGRKLSPRDVKKLVTSGPKKPPAPSV
jgi:hypothetical protein